MAVKFIFEDHDNTPSSILLKSCMFGSNIYFARGNAKLLLRYLELNNSEDTFFLFFDCPPNSSKCVNDFLALQSHIYDKSSYTNVHIIPIICIEYYLCLFLNKYGYLTPKGKLCKLLVDNLVLDFNYSKVQPVISKDKYLSSSLEHVYKYILSQQGLRCLTNSFTFSSDGMKKLDSINGRFYEKDCNCERKYCKIDSTSSLQLKAEQLYASLPFCEISSEFHENYLSELLGLRFKEISLQEVKEMVKNHFNKICLSMGESKIDVR